MRIPPASLAFFIHPFRNRVLLIADVLSNCNYSISSVPPPPPPSLTQRRARRLVREADSRSQDWGLPIPPVDSSFFLSSPINIYQQLQNSILLYPQRRANQWQLTFGEYSTIRNDYYHLKSAQLNYPEILSMYPENSVENSRGMWWNTANQLPVDFRRKITVNRKAEKKMCLFCLVVFLYQIDFVALQVL